MIKTFKPYHYKIVLLLTPLYLIFQWIPGLIHEYSHSVTAWALGYKAYPFDIYYGNFSWQSIFFAAYLDENVNYYLINLLGHPKLMAFIAFIGPAVGVVGVYLISLYFLTQAYIKSNPYLFYFFFWLNLVALAELNSYIYLRSFSVNGDIGIIVKGLDISPWWILIGGGLLLGLANYYFLKNTMRATYKALHIKSTYGRVILLLFCLLLLFGFPAFRMELTHFGSLSQTLGYIMLLLIPCLLKIFWPAKNPP